jgi:hypothetical protein
MGEATAAMPAMVEAKAAGTAAAMLVTAEVRAAEKAEATAATVLVTEVVRAAEKVAVLVERRRAAAVALPAVEARKARATRELARPVAVSAAVSVVA